MLRGLRAEGLEVEHAVDIRSALALEPTCEVAIIDLNLPDGSGVELLDALSRRGQTPIPIFFSATNDPQEIAGAQARGTFIPKSSGVETVVRRVRNYWRESSGEIPAPESSTRPSQSEPAAEASSSLRASSSEPLLSQSSDTTSDPITKTK